MSDDERAKITQVEEEQDEVEAHKKVVNANDEPAAEGESDDDVEAHRARTNAPKKF